ncbi:MAG TPA: kelch repeat-containing protein [Pirellulales bacterium]|nr:kelch repeat-containing protein [Pirellulales bacterium]
MSRFREGIQLFHDHESFFQIEDSALREGSDTWELRGGVWHWIDCSPTPVARHRGAMVYDAVHQCCVLFGGQGSRGEMLDDTWIYSNRRWRRWHGRWFTSGPSPRCGHSLVFDEAEGVVVLFGGIIKGDRSLGDTWIFDGRKWQSVSGAAPAARRYAAFAYDPVLQGCVLHGGSEDDHGQRQFGDTWLFRTGVWSRLPPTFDTDCRDDHGLAYHWEVSKLVMLDGLGGQRGLLVREPNGWRPRRVTPLHPRHQCAPLVWDATLNGLVLHGGEARHGGPQMDATLVLRAE